MEDLAPRPVPTGRHIIQFEPDANETYMRGIMEDDIGVSTTSSSTGYVFSNLLEKLKISIAEIDSSRALALSEKDGVRNVRPEFFLFDVGSSCAQTLDWLRSGCRMFLDTIEAGEEPEPYPWKDQLAEQTRFQDTAESTWGLKAVGSDKTALSGAGVKLCVLDTGFDFGHPDFIDRPITAKSFVKGEDPQDGAGHGTHVAGTIAGPCWSGMGRRYSIAHGADLYVGKVLSNSGSGYEFDVLSGIEWAINEGCHIISMSLGRAVRRNEPPDPLYEAVGKAALDAGCMIIAAAGNESSRSYGYTAPVGSPANATTIMAVGSVDPLLRVSSFSCGGVNVGGGEVDIVGPGSLIYSAWPTPRQSRIISGTSMATPHVSGVAALYAQDRHVRGMDLWQHLTASAKTLGDRRDYGVGLVQVPKGTW